MRLYIVHQFIIFTENVENASIFLSGSCLHKLSNTNVVILYKIVRYSKDLWIARYFPTVRESYNGLSLQVKNFATAVGSREVHPDVMVLHSKVSSKCRPFWTCTPHCRGQLRWAESEWSLPDDFVTKVKQINSQSDLIWMKSFPGPSYLTIRFSADIILI